MKISTKFVLVLLAIFNGSTVAEAQSTADYLSESQKFDQIFRNATDADSVPRLKNKQGAALIMAVSDNKEFLDSPTFTPKDLPVLMEMCGKAHANAVSYILFDPRRTIDRNGSAENIAAQTTAISAKNIVLFQDELSYILPFDIRCLAKSIPVITEFAQSLKPGDLTEARREGLRKMQHGAFTAFDGLLLMVRSDPSEPGIKDSTVTAFLRSLAETAPVYASVLHLESRREILGIAQATQINAPKLFQDDLKKIIDAMADTRCEGLCKL